MTDYTSNIPERRYVRAPKGEFNVYFAIIFAFALLVGVIEWIGGWVVHAHGPEIGPVRVALTQARIITPLIFSA